MIEDPDLDNYQDEELFARNIRSRLVQGPTPEQEAAWQAEQQREAQLNRRSQALTAALHTHGPTGNDKGVVEAAETYLAFLSGGVQ